MRALDSVPEVLRGILSWAGIVTVCAQCFMLTEAGHAALHSKDHAFAPAEYAIIQPGEETLWIDLPAVPYTRPLAEFAAWGALDAGHGRIEADTVTRAIEQGYDTAGITRILGELCGGVPSREVFGQIETWAKQATRLVLRPMTVLTSSDAELLARLRQDSRLRAIFAEPLSAHYAAVYPHAAPALRQALERRGYGVTSQIAPCMAAHTSGDLAPDMAEYLWLAARVYRDLSAFVDLPVQIPTAVLRDLAARLPEGRTAALQQSARLVREQLARTIDGYAALPPPLAQADPAAIRTAIEAAYASQGTLTIEYFSPGYGVPTVRTITPILPITASGGAEYVEAWCHTADAARTFRVDRILRLVSEED